MAESQDLAFFLQNKIFNSNKTNNDFKMLIIYDINHLNLTKDYMSSIPSYLIHAHTIMTEVNQMCSAGHDFIDETEVGLEQPSFQLGYQKYGHRWIQYQVAHLNLQIARDACAKAYDALHKGLQHPMTAEQIAAAKFGYGSCGERALIAFMKASAFCKTVQIELTDDETCQKVLHKRSGHVLVLMNVEESEINTACKSSRVAVEILKKLKTAIILDPLLKVACLASEIETKGDLLIKYISVFKCPYLRDNVASLNPKDKNSIESAYNDSEILFKKAKKLIPTISYSQSATVKWLAEVQTDIASKVLVAVKELIPNVKWKSSIKEGSLFLWNEVNTESESTDQCRLLGERKIRTISGKTTKGTYLIKIENPNPLDFIDKTK